MLLASDSDSDILDLLMNVHNEATTTNRSLPRPIDDDGEYDVDAENDFAAETAAMTQVWHGGDIHEAEIEFVASQASIGNVDHQPLGNNISLLRSIVDGL